MIRIGHVRWFVQASKTRRRDGYVEYRAALVPQARRYRVLAREGPDGDLVEIEVAVGSIEVSAREDSWEMSFPRNELRIGKTLASELASESVGDALRLKLIMPGTVDKGPLQYIVEKAVLRNIQRGQSDEVEQLDYVDLVQDMRELMEQRAQEARERMAREALARRLHAQEEAVRQKLLSEVKEEAKRVSFDLLYDFLNEKEIEELKQHGHVTVKTVAGEFVVPVRNHGLVKQYVDGEYRMSYCVIFRDLSIPIGDEILMKIAMLKACPANFFDVAVRFKEKRSQRMRA